MKLKIPNNYMPHQTIWPLIAIALFLVLFLGNHSTAANFDIKPIKIFLDPQTRIEKLILRNVSEDDLTVQIKGYQWSQNEKGQDVYQETKDIIIFPKIATIKKEEEKIIRIGTNLNSGSVEKTYRIFVEEIPTVEKKDTKGSTIHMYMKIGVPVFISPLRNEEKGMIEAVNLNKGKAEIKVINKGNLHFLVTAIQIKGNNSQGKEVFSTVLGGWYILSGLSKAYEVSIPQDICGKMDKLNIEVKTNNNVVFKEQLQVEKPMCGQSI
jgi:fimbrial chaperone protein